MKRSEFIKEIAKEIKTLVEETEETKKLFTPLEFVDEIVKLFEAKDILNPTHFAMDKDKNLHQVSGWEPENV